MATKRKTRSNNEDSTYIYQEEVDSGDDQEDGGQLPPRKLQKTTPTTKTNNKTTKQKERYVFTEADKTTMVTAVNKYGAGYAAIAKEYFSGRSTAVTRKDIQGYLSLKCNAYLMEIAQTKHKDLKDKSKAQFDFQVAKQQQKEQPTVNCEIPLFLAPN